MANTTPDNWDSTAPVIGDPRRDGAVEIQVLRKGLENRLNREHELMEAAGLGGEHLEGSARGYIVDDEPTNKPDAATALDDDDDGRFWTDSNDSMKLYVWDKDADGGAAWVAVSAVAAGGPIPDSHFDFTGVGNGTFSAYATLTFMARRLTIFKDDGSEQGWGGTFLLPSTPSITNVYLRVYRGTTAVRDFTLERTDNEADDGKKLRLKYDDGNQTEFNGVWNAYAGGA